MIHFVSMLTHPLMYLFSSLSNSTHFYCKTPASAAGDAALYTEDTASLVNFIYKPNPNITVIGRTNIIVG